MSKIDTTQWKDFVITEFIEPVSVKNKLSKLFQPFSCIKNNFNRNTSGSGLGLVLVRKMVILHQGRVNIKSTLHKGTTVQVEFPFQRIVSSGDKNEVV